MSTTRAARPLPLLLVAGLLVGCADDHPTSPDGVATLEAPAVAYAEGPNAAGQILETTDPGVLCGIPVLVTYRRTGADFGNAFGPPAVSNGRTSVIYTNPENGHTMTYESAGRAVREVVDEGTDEDGNFWIEIRETFPGLKGKIGSQDDRVIAFSAGTTIVEIRVTFVLGGPPVVELLDTLFQAGPDDPSGLFESPEQCAIAEDVLL